MRSFVLAAALLLAACGQPAPQAPGASEAPVAAATAAAPSGAAPIWFICDGIDAPVVYLFGDSPSDGRVRFLEYDKRSGASLRGLDLEVGEGEGAAGSLFTPLSHDGAAFGAVRQINPGMLETPGVAYTLPYTSVQIGERTVSCRWLARTRVAAFTGRRSFVIHEDADGDLIYTTFDFAHASTTPIEQSDNGRSTQFSVEVRDGHESIGPGHADFSFTGPGGFSYRIALDLSAGTGVLEVLCNGSVVQSEPLTAYLEGQAQGD